MSFALRLKELRVNHEMSQSQLAKKLNVSPKTISNWENERNLPDINLVIQISKILDVTLDELIIGNHNLQNKLIEDSNKGHRELFMALLTTLYAMLTGIIGILWLLNIQSLIYIIVFFSWLTISLIWGHLLVPKNVDVFDFLSPAKRYTIAIFFVLLGLLQTIGGCWLILSYSTNFMLYTVIIGGLLIIIMTKPIWPKSEK